MERESRRRNRLRRERAADGLSTDRHTDFARARLLSYNARRGDAHIEKEPRQGPLPGHGGPRASLTPYTRGRGFP
jgi:hypothetical protein